MSTRRIIKGHVFTLPVQPSKWVFTLICKGTNLWFNLYALNNYKYRTFFLISEELRDGDIIYDISVLVIVYCMFELLVCIKCLLNFMCGGIVKVQC